MENPDILIGGFPCQDVSMAGKRKGITGDRSGLWKEFYRIICTIRPKYVVVENVHGLLVAEKKTKTQAPIGTVLADLSQSGYDAEWCTLSAKDVGATHKRARIFIIAYSNIVSKRLAFHQVLRKGMEKKKLQAIKRVCIQDDKQKPLFEGFGFWGIKSELVPMVYGIPTKLVKNQITALGNAVVPQVAEVIANRLKYIIEIDKMYENKIK